MKFPWTRMFPKKKAPSFSIGWPYRSKAIFILLGRTLQPTVIIREQPLTPAPHFLDSGLKKPTLFLASRQKQYLFSFDLKLKPRGIQRKLFVWKEPVFQIFDWV
ncbi:hypothetical protein AVEN_154591-1 [Araneus ventricosus]|uniref:Uncharacterized protein n=1 Tax=Araneus ventricosus TaxID=182803 RepID=A0A4Y2FQ45_ARAVE|nr:hypothetical protein AVEN_154591-1 [Araneus ventricosus]